MTLGDAERRRLRAEAQRLRAQAAVGKAGLTPGALEEVRRQLEEHRLLKVRLLAGAREQAPRDALAQELAERVGAELVEVRGNTVVLWRPRRRARPARPARSR